jgi:hypothetical protein
MVYMVKAMEVVGAVRVVVVGDVVEASVSNP